MVQECIRNKPETYQFIVCSCLRVHYVHCVDSSASYRVVHMTISQGQIFPLFTMVDNGEKMFDFESTVGGISATAPFVPKQLALSSKKARYSSEHVAYYHTEIDKC